MTRKKGEDVWVTYVNGVAVEKAAILSFSIENPTDEEKIMSSIVSFQASTPAGISGALDALKSKCDGRVPPQGRLGCVIKFDFSEAPTSLRVRAVGAWFRVQVSPPDGG
jgi:hypothetical protein